MRAKPKSAALTLTERARLVQGAPTERGDHVVSLRCADGDRDRPEVFGVVRVDATGRRLVSIALTASDAEAKARPAMGEPRKGNWHKEAAARGAEGRDRKSAAEIAMHSERADYRRACAAVGIEKAKLV